MICPECGASWDTLKECLDSPDYDRDLAVCIIQNCKTCRQHFDYCFPIYSGIEVEPVQEVKVC